MGRNNLFDYGGVACHVYLELKYKNLDVSRVRLVWNKLIQTHDMLRTVVFEEGYQQVLKEVPELEIPYWDVSKGENICEYNDFRQQMGNHVYDTGKWPMFGIAIAKKAEESILHFSMDFLIADWTSIWMLCIYVPIVADQEIERAKKILEITNANIVLTTVAENSEYMSGKAIIEVDALSDIKFETELPEYGLEDVAYIIFTSGSTGEPKGVTITHAAAVNTIEDINNKNKVTCDDSVLGLSKLNFDLSVYDIFGLLQVGGKIVYPIQENYMNPDHWIKMIEEHRITIWNSVPALMKILLTELETMNTTHMLPLSCL